MQHRTCPKQRLSQLGAVIDDKDSPASKKTFRSYFHTRLYPVLKEYVIDPVKKGKIKSTWTNNNFESATLILKSAQKMAARGITKVCKAASSVSDQ
ncbi:hypothetical protein ACJMK2_001165 [Sinanodonta woodiana]|uniref:Uncharacterized protein n=1 Tax=Sinanodonta woodiana TaxID=1069815 RepID=A0ABD3XUT0_SINWO